MNIYVCMVCGYDYDEAAGDPGGGIKPGTRWADVQDDWVCPICGADKSMFSRQGGEESKPSAPTPVATKKEASGNSQKLQAVMASNLTRALQKQHNPVLSDQMKKVAEFFESLSQPEGDLKDVSAGLQQDSASGYTHAFEAARAAKDRGAQRALTWGEKVTAIQSTLIKRFEKDGDAAFSGNDIFVCDACGFIFVGSEAPEICPVCKVPRFKFNKISKEASA